MYRISVLVALLMATVASAKTIARSATEEANESERIIGGERAQPGQFPWSVALHYDGQFICTASIISPNTVLTAAHCVVLNGAKQPADLFYGIANVSRSAPQVRMDFSEVQVHEEYDESTIDNDIAIFRTTEPIALDGSEGPTPVCLARPDTDAMEYDTATAMGWGNIVPFRFLPPYLPDNLQYAEQKIVSNSRCANLNPGINDEKICAKGPKWSGICNGDSGGPLVHLSDDKPPVQIGIASYINGIVGCGKFAPGVWTRVSSHIDFIMQNAADANAVCLV